jgi:hypothetical protein
VYKFKKSFKPVRKIVDEEVDYIQPPHLQNTTMSSKTKIPTGSDDAGLRTPEKPKKRQ